MDGMVRIDGFCVGQCLGPAPFLWFLLLATNVGKDIPG